MIGSMNHAFHVTSRSIQKALDISDEQSQRLEAYMPEKAGMTKRANYPLSTKRVAEGGPTFVDRPIGIRAKSGTHPQSAIPTR